MHWPLVFGAVAALALLAVVAFLGHVFITAGNAFVYAVGEQAVRAEHKSGRNVYASRVFDFRRWLQGARSAVWRVAGIYGAIFGAGALLVGVAFRGALVVVSPITTREALRQAWQESTNHLGEHLLAIGVIALVTGIATSVISWSKIALPGAREAVTVVSMCWLLSTMTALTDFPEIPAEELTIPAGDATFASS